MSVYEHIPLDRLIGRQIEHEANKASPYTEFQRVGLGFRLLRISSTSQLFGDSLVNPKTLKRMVPRRNYRPTGGCSRAPLQWTWVGSLVKPWLLKPWILLKQKPYETPYESMLKPWSLFKQTPNKKHTHTKTPSESINLTRKTLEPVSTKPWTLNQQYYAFWKPGHRSCSLQPACGEVPACFGPWPAYYRGVSENGGP